MAKYVIKTGKVVLGEETNEEIARASACKLSNTFRLVTLYSVQNGKQNVIQAYDRGEEVI